MFILKILKLSLGKDFFLPSFTALDTEQSCALCYTALAFCIQWQHSVQEARCVRWRIQSHENLSSHHCRYFYNLTMTCLSLTLTKLSFLHPNDPTLSILTY